MSPRRNWDSPTPCLASYCAPPPGTKRGGGWHSRLRVRGWGSPNSEDWRKAEHSAYSVGTRVTSQVFAQYEVFSKSTVDNA
jgi:hypothetical protein